MKTFEETIKALKKLMIGNNSLSMYLKPNRIKTLRYIEEDEEYDSWSAFYTKRYFLHKPSKRILCIKGLRDKYTNYYECHEIYEVKKVEKTIKQISYKKIKNGSRN